MKTLFNNNQKIKQLVINKPRNQTKIINENIILTVVELSQRGRGNFKYTDYPSFITELDPEIKSPFLRQLQKVSSEFKADLIRTISFNISGVQGA